MENEIFLVVQVFLHLYLFWQDAGILVVDEIRNRERPVATNSIFLPESRTLLSKLSRRAGDCRRTPCKPYICGRLSLRGAGLHSHGFQNRPGGRIPACPNARLSQAHFYCGHSRWSRRYSNQRRDTGYARILRGLLPLDQDAPSFPGSLFSRYEDRIFFTTADDLVSSLLF